MATPPTKVLFILDYFPGPVAGTEKQLWTFLTHYDRALIAPSIAVLRPSPWLEQHSAGLPLQMLGIHTILSIRSLWRAFNFAAKARWRGFRVAQLYLGDATVLFPFPLWLFGIRVVTAKRDLGFWQTPAQRRAIRWNRFFVRHVIANAEAARAAAVEQDGVTAAETSVIYNGVELQPTRDRASVRAEWGVAEGDFVIVLVANLKPVKRIDDALIALAQLLPRYPNLRLLVAGGDTNEAASGSQLERLHALAQKLGLLGRIKFLGSVSNTRDLIAAADVGLLCSESEGLSNALIEYQLAGIPAIASRVGGNPEVVETGRTGLLFELGDVDGLARALESLVSNPAQRRELGEAAKARAIALFGVTSMVDAHQRLYRSLAS
jgi:glycosyltransferase involved in cell wall biosynthesis